jgi:ribosomal protein S18 acetylase RimI-like enzyme
VAAPVRPTSIIMVLPTLEAIPPVVLPDGFGLRWHQPGDETAWLAIQRASDLINEFPDDAFARHFGTDAAEHGRRIVHLEHDGRLVGTSAAWWSSPPFGPEAGRIHWVAVLPAYQGRGLGKALLSATLLRLRAFGNTSAYLQTDTRRPVAIGLYQRFGFGIVGAA